MTELLCATQEGPVGEIEGFLTTRTPFEMRFLGCRYVIGALA
jgi:hypothetical protein